VLFHLHAKDVPSYVKAVKVGHKGDVDQKQLAELTIGETPRVVREAAERACDKQGGQIRCELWLAVHRGLYCREQRGEQKEGVNITLSTSWQLLALGDFRLPPLMPLTNSIYGASFQ